MLAETPPMGWNSWNTFGRDINENLIKETADALISEGLKDAGYQYVCIDDSWHAPERDANNRLQWHPERFPSGIPALAEYIHSKGLKFGIYSCAGTHTCMGEVSSYGYEDIDARTFAEWGADLLKYDFCYKPIGVEGRKLYERMGQELRTSGREILFSMCEGGRMEPWRWGASAGAQMWRTTQDIKDSWESIEKIGFEQQKRLERYAGPGHWNDPDMLVVGMYDKGHVAEGGCTDEEYRLHFSLWCMLAAPLFLGCDVRNMNDFTKELITNPEVIAVNQDPLGVQGKSIGSNYWKAEVWRKPLKDGSIAVGVFHRGDREDYITPIAWEALSLDMKQPAMVRDLWAHEDLGVHTRHFSVKMQPHTCRMFKITPINA